MIKWRGVWGGSWSLFNLSITFLIDAVWKLVPGAGTDSSRVSASWEEIHDVYTNLYECKIVKFY